MSRNLLSEICDLVNYAIAEGDSKYGTNIGSNFSYTPDRLNKQRQVYKMNIQCVQDPLNNNKVLGNAYHYLNPKIAFNYPEWMEDDTNPNPILLNSFVVDPDYRKMGIGSEMLNKMINYYNPMDDYSSIFLKVIDDNNGARNIYKKCNFEDYRYNIMDGDIPHTIMIYRFQRI